MKHERGLTIHKTRMKWRERELEEQHTGSNPGEVQEEPHRGQDLQALQPPMLDTASQRSKIRWPTANKQSELWQFEEDVWNITQTRTQSVHSMMTIIMIIMHVHLFILPDIPRLIGRRHINL